MIIQINSEKIIQIGSEEPRLDLINFGWDWEIYSFFFNFLQVIVYTKPLIKN